eukprot:2481619-Pyramimonas_sp.AAC.1
MSEYQGGQLSEWFSLRTGPSRRVVCLQVGSNVEHVLRCAPFLFGSSSQFLMGLPSCVYRILRLRYRIPEDQAAWGGGGP